MATDFGFLPVTGGEHYFISYNTEDTARVRPIAQALSSAGVPLWYDYGLEYGKEWERQIAVNIHEAKAVIMFVTDGVFRRDKTYVRREFDIAEAYGVQIIPVVLDKIAERTLPEHTIGWWMDIRSLHSVQLNAGETAQQGCSKIMYALGISPAAEPVPAPGMSAMEMNSLGDDYYYGRNGKPQNYSEAVSWFRKAAEQGHARAQFNLGICYEKGLGVEKNHTEAVRLYHNAAEKGHAVAQCYLGNCYENGHGVARDAAQARHWYELAAAKGDIIAKKALERLK